MGKCSTHQTLPEDPQTSLFVDGELEFKAHQVGFIVCGGLSLIASITTAWLVSKHLAFYTKPLHQRHIVRLLFMVPVYAWVGSFGDSPVACADNAAGFFPQLFLVGASALLSAHQRRIRSHRCRIFLLSHCGVSGRDAGGTRRFVSKFRNGQVDVATRQSQIPSVIGLAFLSDLPLLRCEFLFGCFCLRRTLSCTSSNTSSYVRSVLLSV